MGQKVCHLYFYYNVGKCRPSLTAGRSNMAKRTSHTAVKCCKQSPALQRLFTSCDSRIAFTTSLVRRETDESRTRGRSNMKNAPKFQNWGPDPRLRVTLSG